MEFRIQELELQLKEYMEEVKLKRNESSQALVHSEMFNNSFSAVDRFRKASRAPTFRGSTPTLTPRSQRYNSPVIPSSTTIVSDDSANEDEADEYDSDSDDSVEFRVK
ncbi:hypothetical protein ABK040_004840 [Willaertia magna]